MRIKAIKRVTFLMTIIIAAAMLCTPVYAAGLGEIATVFDIIRPEGENALIVTVITGTTDDEGNLAIPLYSKTTLLDVTVQSGTLIGELAEGKNGATKYYIAKFAEAGQEVTIQLTSVQEETYVIGNAKTKDTAPGGMKAIKYSMVNSSPVKIGDYSAQVAIPKGYELSAIVGYNPEKNFAVYETDGYKTAYQGFGALKPGEGASITINMQKTSNALQIGAWIVTIIASAFFLYMNRGMLAKARELKQARGKGR